MGLNSYSADIIYTDSDQTGVMDNNSYQSIQPLGNQNVGPYLSTDSQSNNNIYINYSTAPQVHLVYGGLSESLVSSNMIFILNDSLIADTVYGGYSIKGDVTHNKVFIEGLGLDNANKYTVQGGLSVNGEASYNHVEVTASKMIDGVTGGSSEQGSSNYNKIIINNSDVNDVVGGISLHELGGANNNQVVIGSGSNVSTRVLGGLSGGVSNYNTVTIAPGAIVETVIGATGVLESKYNVVDVYGHVETSIFGGKGFDVSDNTINLHASATLGSGTDIYGADSLGLSLYSFQNNNLNLSGFSGSFNSIQYIDNLSFFSVPLSSMNSYSVALTTPMDLKEVNVHVDSIDGSVEDLQVGDTLKLISSTTNTDQAVYDIDYVTSGLAAYDFDLDKDDVQGLSIRLVEVLRQPYHHIKSILSGQLASLALLVQGSDKIMQVMDQISLDDKDHIKSSWNAFTHVTGGQSRYINDSYIDLQSTSLVSGFSFFDKSMLFGMFAEAGWGNYHNVDEFPDYAHLNSDGKSHYTGGGLFARYMLPKGFYIDGSARLGKITNDFNSRDIIIPDRDIQLTTNSTYYGAQLGFGHRLNFHDHWSLGFSSHYLWSHQSGSQANFLGASSSVNIYALNSQRLRSMVQINYVNKGFSPYLSLGYDREFDALARAYYRNDLYQDIGGLHGHSGIGGIGFKLSSGQSLLVHVGIQGYVGDRQGYSATASFQWRF